MYNQAFSFLPERYRKPTTKQLYYVIFKGFNDIQDAITSVQDSRDIDKVTGKTLDLIGGNVGQFRIDEDDELYRLLIKTRIIANLSKGDIPTINHVSSTLLKHLFLGIEEVWQSKYFEEPSAINIKLATEIQTIPFELLNRIKSAGVRVFYGFLYTHNLYLASHSFKTTTKTLFPAEFIEENCNMLQFSNYSKRLRIIEMIVEQQKLKNLKAEKDLNLAMNNVKILRVINTNIKE